MEPKSNNTIICLYSNTIIICVWPRRVYLFWPYTCLYNTILISDVEIYFLKMFSISYKKHKAQSFFSNFYSPRRTFTFIHYFLHPFMFIDMCTYVYNLYWVFNIFVETHCLFFSGTLFFQILSFFFVSFYCRPRFKTCILCSN